MLDTDRGTSGPLQGQVRCTTRWHRGAAADGPIAREWDYFRSVAGMLWNAHRNSNGPDIRAAVGVVKRKLTSRNRGCTAPLRHFHVIGDCGFLISSAD
jgi:hypothetical protein